MEKRNDLVSQVKKAIFDQLCRRDHECSRFFPIDDVVGGKMLRTRLAARLIGDGPVARSSEIVAVCAATELLHTASLFHDDVVDHAGLRRGKPTLWQALSANAAILSGDLLFCEALSILAACGSGRLLTMFTEKVGEVCTAEAEQEISLRGTPCDTATCLRVARGKTGPLFAFVAWSCGGTDPSLSAALEEAGYRIGTAYQLADDLLDEQGTEAVAGKTLGTDRLRKKFTLAQTVDDPRAVIGEQLARQCGSAVELLSQWPRSHEAVRTFIECDLRLPVLAWPRSAKLDSCAC